MPGPLGGLRDDGGGHERGLPGIDVEVGPADRSTTVTRKEALPMAF
jgi:hypothetical protein